MVILVIGLLTEHNIRLWTNEEEYLIWLHVTLLPRVIVVVLNFTSATQTVPCLFPQDLTYASLSKLPQSKDGVSRQLELEESTDYAQIKGVNPSPSPLPPSYEAHMQRQRHTTER